MSDELEAALAISAPLLGESDAERARLDAPSALLAAALHYASIGWPVFPCAPGGKRPLTTNGLLDASTDPAAVASWWTYTPNANIGVATGVRFDVIDIDAPEGFEGFAELRADLDARGGELPQVHAVASTGSGGRHLLILPRVDSHNGAKLRRGVDYRARGGYVVVPPSRLDGLDRYRWLIRPSDALIGSAP